MRFEFLGPMVVWSDDGARVSVGGPKQRTVLAVLCLSPGEPVSADRIIDAVWGDPVPGRARQVVQTYVSNLRRELDALVAFESGTYTLVVDRSAVDWCRFTGLVESGDALPTVEAAAPYGEALGLWRGAPFSGLEGHGVFDDAVAVLEAGRVRAEVGVVEAELASGDAVAVMPRVELMVAANEFDERVRGLHMRALYAAGRQRDALASFDGYRTRLVEEFGLEPAEELAALELKILNHDPGLDRLRDMAGSGVGGVSALPLRFSSFRGRSDELQRVEAWLDGDDSQRLLTLLGPGGIGKTRIAVEALRRHVTDDVKVYVRIDQTTEPNVGMLVALALGLAPGPGIDPIPLAATRLSKAPHVLLFDGCESDVALAAATATALLESSPCRILATSRMPLGLGGEAHLRIGPLGNPEAAALFQDRAAIPETANIESTDTITGICNRLDGMPLAIELAAARVEALSLDRVAERLHDQIALLSRHTTRDHHGSLRATLDWSFDLLTGDEQNTLLAVSTFAASFTLDDAAALIGRTGAEDLVAALVEASFIQPPDGRGEYRMLEPIRQYATWHLQNTGGIEPAQQRHSSWAADYAQQAARHMYTPREPEAHRRLFEKRDDLLTAIQTAMNHDDPEPVLRILASAGRSLYRAGLHDLVAEPAWWAIKHPAATANDNYPMACFGALFVGWRYTTPEEENAVIEQALALADQAGDVRAQSEILHYWSMPPPPFVPVPDRDQQKALDRSIDLARQSGESRMEQSFLLNKALAQCRLGRLDEAEAAIHRAEMLGDGTIVQESQWLGRRAYIAILRGDVEAAIHLHEQGAQAAEAEAGYLSARSMWREVGLCAIRTGRIDELRRSQREVERIDDIVGPFPSIPYDIEIALLDGDYDTVLDLARQWIGYHPIPKDGEDLTPTENWVLYGNEGHFPGLFIILRSATTALYHSGRTTEACWIAAQLRTLIDRSPYQHWDSYREEALWVPILSRCGTCVTSEDLTPIEVYRRITDIIGSTRPDPYAAKPRLYEI